MPPRLSSGPHPTFLDRKRKGRRGHIFLQVCAERAKPINQIYTPDDLKGNVVLLMFWATWRPYCKKVMPHMNTFASEYANAPFTLVGMCGTKDADTWHNYIEQHQLRWLKYLDRDLRMAHLFQAHDVLNSILIDKDGYLVAHWAGWDDALTNQVQKLIDHTLAMPRRQ